jgi:hypothetical protein
MNARSLAVALLAALLPAGVAAAQDAVASVPFEIVAVPPRPAPGAPLRLDVAGVLRKGCRPQLVETIVRGADIVLRTEPDRRDCAGSERKLQLSTRTLDGALHAPAAPGVYRVRVEAAAHDGAPPRVLAFRLLDVAAADQPAPPPPESGFWWGEAGGEFDVAKPGFGAQLELQAATLALTFSHYAQAGVPEWSLAAGTLNGRVADLPLNRLSGGQGPFAPFSGPVRSDEIGRVLIEWTTPARAVFWFVQRRDDDSLLLQPVSMVRFAFANAQQGSWRGRWVLLPATGGGAARVIDFDAHDPVDGGFELRAATGERLLCRTTLTRPNSPPRECRLQRGDDAPIVFDQAGLDRLHGAAPGGARMLLLRAER